MTVKHSPGVVVVTGGTYGIGAGISLGLARDGWKVVAFGLERRQLSSAAENGGALLRAQFAQERLTGEVLEADVADEADVRRVMDTAIAKYGQLDALVNNAAIGPLGNVLQTAPDEWDRVISVNLRGAYLCSRHALPHMIDAGGGAIVNIGSGSGWGKPNMAAYAASKGGLYALTMAMAYDHHADHVRVNMVIPGGGGIVTGMSEGRRDPGIGRVAPLSGGKSPSTVAGRPATPADIAAAVGFLVSQAAEAVSGTVIDVGCFAHQGGPVPRRGAPSEQQ